MLAGDRNSYNAANQLRTAQATPLHPTALPLPYLMPLSAAAQFYCAVTPVDARGRLADGSPLRLLKWSPGQHISITVTPPHTQAIISVRAHGPNNVTRQGHIRIPAAIRHQCGISSGDRLLVVATPPTGLTIYPMSTLAQLLNRHPTRDQP